MDANVPVLGDIDDLYTSDAIIVQRERWTELVKCFVNRYGQRPDFVTRSPGRVNIIGEHIDYSLYEVLPMAIAADVLVAVRALPRHVASEKLPKFTISNTDVQTFDSLKFRISRNGDVEIDPSTHEWTTYFKAGLRGAMNLLKEAQADFSPCGMEILVDGTVPTGGGLSSSAAFVCASALAVLKANGKDDIGKRELVELAIVSERAVGVNSGGMDQAASVFSIRGNALSVSFSPKLHTEAIAFPKTRPAITFMVAQSFVAADKHVTAPYCYNLRVVECTLAAEVMASRLGLKLKTDSGPLKKSLRGLQEAYFSSPSSGSEKPYEEQLEIMRSLAGKLLPDECGYTREQISASLGVSIPVLERSVMNVFPVKADRFFLRQRALHVFSEALRVVKFKQLLQSPLNYDDVGHEALFTDLGDLMNQTQASCRDVYDCSCPELDELCEIARQAGSYGSRLTGAGWGGCSVHLVPKEKIAAIRAAWEDKYYLLKFPNITPEKLKEAIIISEPGHGSTM
ncbi:galactokinase [Toensbergia leucococca]|nr:galactokinase [Toensbergia leucococca]